MFRPRAGRPASSTARRGRRKRAIRSALNTTFSEADVQAVLSDIDSDITDIEAELNELNNIERDFVEFLDFSFDFIEDLRERFWHLDAEHLGWCKQLLFPEGFSVSRDKKVYTPKVSDFYRLISTQKDPEGSSESNMVRFYEIARTHFSTKC